LSEPISLAKQKATARGLTTTFRVMDALTLKDLPEVFDTVIDSVTLVVWLRMVCLRIVDHTENAAASHFTDAIRRCHLQRRIGTRFSGL